MTKRKEKVSKYKRIKLLPETITVIKKALIAYKDKCKDLEIDRQYALEQLRKEDYFIVLYSYEYDNKVCKTESKQLNLKHIETLANIDLEAK